MERFDAARTPMRQLTATLVCGVSRVVMRGLNRVTIEGADRFREAVERRPSDRGLLTLSNHVSLFDDPLLTACLVGPAWEPLRWIAGDARNFHGSPAKARLFNAGKVVPVVRGAGLDQPGMTFLAERLRQGDWVHVFPEGTRTRRPDGGLSLPFKGGFAHLVKEAAPLVLPFHHAGMRGVLPVGAKVPRVGRAVSVMVGELTDARVGLADQSVAEITRWGEEALVGIASA